MNKCNNCQNPAKNKYCSRICAGKASKGGYRNGSGRAKTGYYKGIYCGSTYELVWVIYNLDNAISFERFNGFLECDGVRYFPDFIQNGKIVEIKGFESEESVNRKTRVAAENGYEVIVLRKRDLSKQFQWVRSNYKYAKVYELYDDYKPEYQYCCNFCGSDFVRHRKVKTSVKYCTRMCAGKSRVGKANVSGINQYTKANMLHSSTG